MTDPDEPPLIPLTQLEAKLGEVASAVADHPLWKETLGQKRHGLHNFVLASLTEATRGLSPVQTEASIERLDKLMQQIKRMR